MSAPWWEAGLRLLLAMALGGIVGWQRESAEKPAGFRTNIATTSRMVEHSCSRPLGQEDSVFSIWTMP